MIGRKLACRLGVAFGVVDISLTPTTAALVLLINAVKRGNAMASGHVGGLSGTFIPVSEDLAMIEAVEKGALSLKNLEAMTAVCSVGLDMLAVPGDTPAHTISALIADELAIGAINNKATGVRVILAPGLTAGQSVDFGGLLGRASVMPISPFNGQHFISRGGHLPAPVTGLRPGNPPES